MIEVNLTLAVGAENIDPAKVGTSLEFLASLDDPRGRLVNVTHANFVEHEYNPDPAASRVTLEGLGAFQGYREGFGDFVAPDGTIVGGAYVDEEGVVVDANGEPVEATFVGPELTGYDIIIARPEDAFVIPGSGGERYTVPAFFRSRFRIPAQRVPEGIDPEEMPDFGIILDEHTLVEMMANGVGIVTQRMYRPSDKDGPMGPGTDRPDETQHALVVQQFEHAIKASRQGRPPEEWGLKLPTVEEVFAVTHPGVELGDRVTLQL